MATAGQQRDDRPRLVEPMARAELFARRGHSNAVEQRMADVINLDAVALVIVLLERQDDQHLLDVAFDRVNTIAAPGPDLRADVIDHAMAVAFEPLRQPQVEFWPVNQDHQPRLAFIRRVAQAAKDAQEFRQGPGDFEGAHNRHFTRVYISLDPGLPHLVAARAEKFKRQVGTQRAQGRDKLRAMFVARSLPSDDHQRDHGLRIADCGLRIVWRRLTWLFLFFSRRHRNSLTDWSEQIRNPQSAIRKLYIFPHSINTPMT